ncbi:MAG: nitrous oxide reductase family maturation protein NosD [Candidatus Thorarchaeota archaeon]
MGQDVKDRSRVCPLPPRSENVESRHIKSRTIIMTVSISFILTTTGIAYYGMQPPSTPQLPIPPPAPLIIVPGTPHDPIWIFSERDFSETALLEGWPGNGSPENPYIIDGLDISNPGHPQDHTRAHCIGISNTRVSFIIRNCHLNGASREWPGRAGIFLENVMHGEIMNNILYDNGYGILIQDSENCTVANNICYNNTAGIELDWSSFNTFSNNSCNDNYEGIEILDSSFNTLSDNTCYNNTKQGIFLRWATNNIIANNTCYNNYITTDRDLGGGIQLHVSDFNIVVNNTCANNNIGIFLYESRSTNMVNNICFNNTNHDIYILDPEPITEMTWGFDPVLPLPVIGCLGFIGITLMGTEWRMRGKGKKPG